MYQRSLRIVRLGLIALVGVAAGSDVAPAGDCCRQMGIGYGAGYHAPAPSIYSPIGAARPGHLHWKSACCHPGAQPLGNDCGCGCEYAAPGGSCFSPYGLFGSCGFGSRCATRNPGVY